MLHIKFYPLNISVNVPEQELAHLKKIISQLTSRIQLLTSLLKEAGISVPAEPALEKISPLKWSNKINVDDVDKYFNKIEESKYRTVNNINFFRPTIIPCYRKSFRKEKEGEICRK